VSDAAPIVAWSATVKTLHWTLILVLLFEVPAGFLMSYTYGPSFHDRQVLTLHNLLSQIHHTAGFLVLAAACAWVALRLSTSRPPFPTAMPAYQRGLARLAQAALMTLLILIPWSGWTALSALADSPRFGPTHIWFFGTDGLIPRIWRPLPANDPLGYGRFGRLHRSLLIAGAGIVAVHAASALWHQFVRRDGILARMWPLGR